MSAKRIIASILILAVLGVCFFILYKVYKAYTIVVVTEPKTSLQVKVIGTSVEGRAIEAYTYGAGEKQLVFVGGIHGGYEWNSVLLAYRFMDYLVANPDFIPKGVMVTVIPSANPDGVYKVVKKEGRFTAADVPATGTEVGRFNAHNVDLNRNSDCNWQATSTWRSKIVSAGSAVFSEPETAALRDFFLKNKPAAVIFYHSQSNAIYASACQAGILPATTKIMTQYSLASGYPAVDTFTSYAITGDIGDWLAAVGIPAITVELKTHETIEWEQNLFGIKALIGYLEKKI